MAAQLVQMVTVVDKSGKAVNSVRQSVSSYTLSFLTNPSCRASILSMSGKKPKQLIKSEKPRLSLVDNLNLMTEERIEQ